MKSASDIVDAHELWRSQCINLIPSENLLSNDVRRLLATDMASRYTLPINQEVHGTFVENAYRGTKGLDNVEALAISLASDIFRARHVTFAPLSGHIAAMNALLSLCEKGDTVMALASEHGGYDGYNSDYLPDMLGLRTETLPFNENLWNVDAEAAADKIGRIKPKLVVLGASFFPFPHPVMEITDACKDAGTYLAYDGCHVLGLIAGGEFQDPLAEGADLLIGNTHKSFPGPQGGVLLTNDDGIFESVLKNITWRTVDNIHWNRIAATARALEEMREFGRDYASAVVRNSGALASSLETAGIKPLFGELGYTKSHQIILDPAAMKKNWGKDFNSMAVRLEKMNIITDAVGRVGTNEVSRLGMGPADMETVAGLMSDALKGENMLSDVIDFRKKFHISYC